MLVIGEWSDMKMANGSMLGYNQDVAIFNDGEPTDSPTQDSSISAEVLYELEMTEEEQGIFDEIANNGIDSLSEEDKSILNSYLEDLTVDNLNILLENYGSNLSYEEQLEFENYLLSFISLDDGEWFISDIGL